MEKVTPEREQAAGQVWVADCDGDIIGCLFLEAPRRPGVSRVCRLVTGSWYRREGLGRLLLQGLEQRQREARVRRVYAHVPFPSKVAEVIFRKLGYVQVGEGPDEGGGEGEERPERGFMGYPLTKVFYKDVSFADRKS